MDSLSDPNIFPFFTLQSSADLQLAVGVSSKNIIGATIDLPLFNPFDLNDSNTSDNSIDIDWDPNSCSYITSDNLNSLPCMANFSILQVNCRSLCKNLQSLEVLLSNCHTLPTIITVSETCLHDNNTAYYDLPNYNFISLPRTGKKGGGVGIYISNSLSYCLKTDLSLIMAGVCEYIVVEIDTCTNGKVLLVSLYRPPDTDMVLFNQGLNNFMSHVTSRQKRTIIIAGDTNIDLIKSSTHVQTEYFLNQLMSFGFMPTITRPTRITEFTATLIDNIFINFLDLNYTVHIIHDDISDHLPTLLSIDLLSHGRTSLPSFPVRSYKSGNCYSFFERLKKIDWSIYTEGTFSQSNSPQLFGSFLKF